ncbi:MAG: nickel-binding protein, partial [Candidatus Bathyarchaeia archaeon]
MAITIEIRSHCSFDAYWVRTWVVLDQEKQYCEWDAKDAEPIRKVFEKVPEIAATVEAIYQME